MKIMIRIDLFVNYNEMFPIFLWFGTPIKTYPHLSFGRVRTQQVGYGSGYPLVVRSPRAGIRKAP
jgi:hypothetical protein